MTIKKRELEKFLRLHRYNAVYIRHISDILRKNISMRIMPYGYRKRGNIIKSNGFNKKNKDSPSSTSVGRGGII